MRNETLKKLGLFSIASLMFGFIVFHAHQHENDFIYDAAEQRETIDPGFVVIYQQQFELPEEPQPKVFEFVQSIEDWYIEMPERIQTADACNPVEVEDIESFEQRTYAELEIWLGVPECE